MKKAFELLLSFVERLANHRALLILILLAAFGIRIAMGVFLGFNAPPDREACGADTVEFEAMAWSASQGDGFRQYEGGSLTAFRAPGYPMMLAAVYRILGRAYWANRVVLSVVGTVTCLLVYMIVIQIGLGRFTASIAAAVAAFLPSQFYYAGHFMSDVPATFLNVGAALLFVVALRKIDDAGRAARAFVFAGLVCGLATLVRPAALLVPPALGFCFLFVKKIRFPRKVWTSVLAFMALLLVVAPWTLRNYRVFDRFCLVTTNGGSTFWGANNDVVSRRGQHWGRWVSTGFDIERKRAEVWVLANEVDRDKKEWAIGREFIKQNPGRIPALLAGKFYRLLTPFPVSPNKIFVMIIAAGQIFLLPLSLAGMIMMLRSQEGLLKFSPINAQLLVLVATTAIFYGSPRFRSAYEPLLGIYAAVAIAAVVHKLHALLTIKTT